MTPSKRALDIIGATLGLVVTLPLLLLIPFLIKLDDRGPVFFRQVRIGRNGRPFRMWKFRTMRPAESTTGDLTVGDDPRFTRVGRWLREPKLDELPQLVHVLLGQMSLVGPRPEVERYVRLYTPDQARILELVPGITSPASLRFWDESEILGRADDPQVTYTTRLMPEKIRIHLEYAERATVASDLRLLLRTASRVWPVLQRQAAVLVVRYRRPFIIAVHVLLAAFAYMAAYQLRFDFDVPGPEADRLWITLPLLMAARLLSYLHFGLFRGMWRHAGLEDLVALCKAASLGSLAFVMLLVFAGQFPGVPRSVLVLEWVGTIFLAGGLRFVVRYTRERWEQRMRRPGRSTLILGDGGQAERLLREIGQDRGARLSVVGLVGVQAGGVGRSLRGVRVLGQLEDLGTLVDRHHVEFVIIALDTNAGELMQRAVAACVAARVEFQTVPSLHELLEGISRLDQLRRVRLPDLLGRAPVELDFARVGPTVAGKVVLITGAAGSIGSELARQVARLRPARLVLLDQAESPLYFTMLELIEAHPGLDIHPVVCDVCDHRSVLRVFLDWRPQYVIHAAAYKHVPMMEDNVLEAVRNNVLGTMHLANAACTSGAERFVLISTDKAVRPSSVMGATKRVAERLVLGLPTFQRCAVDYRAVRFGNVLGSAGSVVPLFERQVAIGGPVTVTHPEVERYFMTIPEAAQLVLEAGALEEASGRVTMLDMGQPVRILDLAERLIRLAGLQPHQDVPIVFTGLRPGEKLREELMSGTEATVPTAVDKIQIVQTVERDGDRLAKGLGQLAQAVAVGDAPRALDLLCDLVPECVPPLSGRRSDQYAAPRISEPIAMATPEPFGAVQGVT